MLPLCSNDTCGISSSTFAPPLPLPVPLPARFGHNAKIVHFTGAVKPWSAGKSREDSRSHLMEQFVSLWWREYLSYPAPAPPEEPLQPAGSHGPHQVRSSCIIHPLCRDWSQRTRRKTDFLLLPRAGSPKAGCRSPRAWTTPSRCSPTFPDPPRVWERWPRRTR